MSRLYEALKGANRNRKNNNGRDSLWDVLDINADESSPSPGENSAPAGTPAIPVSLALPSNGHSKPIPTAAFEADAVVLEEHHELGTVTRTGLDQKARLLPFSANPALADHYRRLRTKLIQQREAKPFRSMVVTSAAPQEGKTVTVLNLAFSFSTLPDFKVLVVDGDLRRGTLGSWLGVSNEQAGLSNLFRGTANLEDVLLKSDQVPMHFMVRGNEQVRDLHPSHFAGHFQKLTELYDLVLIDSPPVNLLADVQLLAANSDAVLLVARAFSTTRKSLEKAAQELAPFRIVGAVLNAGVAQRSYRYYGYY